MRKIKICYGLQAMKMKIENTDRHLQYTFATDKVFKPKQSNFDELNNIHI